MARASERILVVDDDEAMRAVLVAQLAQAGYRARSVASGEEALASVEQHPTDVVITDWKMSGLNGTELVRELVRRDEDIPVIMISGAAKVTEAVAAIQAGVKEFLEKPFDRQQLLAKVDRVCELYVRRPMPDKLEPGVLDSTAPAMAECQKLIERCAKKNETILLLGETGVGKDMAARKIHELSGRKVALVSVNCAAIQDSLIESQLFGYQKGAFTDAVKDTPGLIESAHHGTFFFDEIGDMSFAMQAKVLRLLQERELTRVGGTTSISVDVRFVAATTRDLEAMVANGTFRQDLYYRISTLKTTIPPLRARMMDLPQLTRRFHRSACARYEIELPLGPDAVDALMTHSWPGNVRELKSVVDRCVLLCDAPAIGAADIVRSIERPVEKEDTGFPCTLKTAENRARRRAIEAALAATGNNMTKAAVVLGCARRSVYYMMEELGMPLPREDESGLSSSPKPQRGKK